MVSTKNQERLGRSLYKNSNPTNVRAYSNIFGAASNQRGIISLTAIMLMFLFFAAGGGLSAECPEVEPGQNPWESFFCSVTHQHVYPVVPATFGNCIIYFKVCRRIKLIQPIPPVWPLDYEYYIHTIELEPNREMDDIDIITEMKTNKGLKTFAKYRTKLT
jgi:hypothetical protein